MAVIPVLCTFNCLIYYCCGLSWVWPDHEYVHYCSTKYYFTVRSSARSTVPKRTRRFIAGLGLGMRGPKQPSTRAPTVMFLFVLTIV